MGTTEKLDYDQLLLNFLYFRSSKDPLTATGFWLKPVANFWIVPGNTFGTTPAGRYLRSASRASIIEPFLKFLSKVRLPPAASAANDSS